MRSSMQSGEERLSPWICLETMIYLFTSCSYGITQSIVSWNPQDLREAFHSGAEGKFSVVKHRQPEELIYYLRNANKKIRAHGHFDFRSIQFFSDCLSLNLKTIRMDNVCEFLLLLRDDCLTKHKGATLALSLFVPILTIVF